MHSASPVTVVLAQPYALDRAVLRAALEEADDIVVVAEAAKREACVQQAARCRPTVVLLDASLARSEAVAACAALKSLKPAPRVLLVGGIADHDLLHDVVEVGADGYVMKDGEIGPLLDAVRRVGRGEAVVPPRMLGTLLRSLIQRNRRDDRAVELFMRLTRREREVLTLLADGCDGDAVAKALVISPQTARTHIQNVIQKLEVHSRLEAAALAVEHDFLEWAPSSGQGAT